MNFGEMVAMLQANHVAIARRRGWNGKGMAIALMPWKLIHADKITEHTRALLALVENVPNEAEPLAVEPYFAMYTAKGSWQPGWFASQADMLSIDWEVRVGSITNWRS